MDAAANPKAKGKDQAMTNPEPQEKGKKKAKDNQGTGVPKKPNVSSDNNGLSHNSFAVLEEDNDSESEGSGEGDVPFQPVASGAEKFDLNTTPEKRPVQPIPSQKKPATLGKNKEASPQKLQDATVITTDQSDGRNKVQTEEIPGTVRTAPPTAMETPSDGSITIPPHSALNNAFPLTAIVTRAYDRIIDSTPKHNTSYRCPSQFAITPVGLPLWCIWLKDEAPSSDSEIKLSHARAGFRLSQDNLMPTNLRDLPPTAEWTRAPVATYWTAQKKPPQRVLLHWEDNGALIAALQWKDKSNFLAAPSANIRKIVSADSSAVQNRLRS
ncbi:hypothetical protein R1sor_005781 [Riccia sorocarpa]|uniref:Uncharacterized protein n=1 Tax=Riccia sorocarpa TaxID=122646 RepID=A0ABD3HKH8_9MARC